MTEPTDTEPRDEPPEQAAHEPPHPTPHLPPHPPFARSSEEYTDPPGHHRKGKNGPALDVGG